MTEPEVPVADYLDLSVREVPRDGFLLADLIRGAVSRLVPHRDMRDFQLTCEINGHDVPMLDADLSNWCLPIPDNFLEEPAEPAPAPVAVARGMIGRFTLRAAPVIIEDCPIFFKMDLRSIPITWYTTALGTAGVGFDAAECEPSPTSGRFLLEISPQRVADLVARVVNRQPDTQGLKISRPRASVTAISETEFEATAACRVRYKLLWLRAAVAIGGRLSSSGTVTIESVSLRGSSLPLRLLGRAARSELLGPVNLNDYLPEGNTFTGLRFKAGQTLRISGKILAR